MRVRVRHWALCLQAACQWAMLVVAALCLGETWTQSIGIGAAIYAVMPVAE